MTESNRVVLPPPFFPPQRIIGFSFVDVNSKTFSPYGI